MCAEREGFEPPDPCESTVFKTAAFDHSAISLYWSVTYPNTKVQRFFLKVNSVLSFFKIFFLQIFVQNFILLITKTLHLKIFRNNLLFN